MKAKRIGFCFLLSCFIMSQTLLHARLVIPYVNNETCPVTGKKNGKRPAYAIVEGKRYSCASKEAAEKLEKYPEKYIKK